MVPKVPWHRAQPLFRADHQLHRNVVLGRAYKNLGDSWRSKLLYALSAWGGYISIDNVGRLNKILRKA